MATARPYRRSEHGPAYRLLKLKKITYEQFWAAEEFARMHELANISPVRAQSFEQMPRGKFTAPQEGGMIDTSREYNSLVQALYKEDRRRRREPVLYLILVEVAANHTSMEELDTRLMRRKQWTRGILIEALEFLTKRWDRKIQAFKKALVAERSPTAG